MNYSVEFKSDPRWSEFELALKKAARNTLEHQSAEAGTLTVVLTDREHIQELNRIFAGEDHPTDVLSFADGSELPEGDGVYFGDVVIAVDVAEEQAAAAGNTLEAELCLLSVHGVLHLLGHDHRSTSEKSQMWAAQDEILSALAIKLVERHVDE